MNKVIHVFFKTIILILFVSGLYANDESKIQIETSKEDIVFNYVIKPPKDNLLSLDISIDSTYLKEPDKDVGVDILLLIDSTGSMGDIIDMIKTQIDEITSFLLIKYPNIHIAIASISEHSTQVNHDAYRTIQDFTNDSKLIKSNIANLRIDDIQNTDYPEAYLYGLSRSLDLSWRDDSQKIVFFIGDSWGHEPDKGLDKKLDTSDDLYTDVVLDTYKDKKIQICSYYVDKKKEAKNYFKKLSEETNGFIKPVQKNSDVKNDFLTVLKSIVGLNYTLNNPFGMSTNISQNENHFLYDIDLSSIDLKENNLIKVMYTYNNESIAEITVRLVSGKPWGVLILLGIVFFVLISYLSLRFIYKSIYTTTIVDYEYLKHYVVLIFALACYVGVMYVTWMAIDIPNFPIIWNKLWW